MTTIEPITPEFLRAICADPQPGESVSIVGELQHKVWRSIRRNGALMAELDGHPYLVTPVKDSCQFALSTVEHPGLRPFVLHWGFKAFSTAVETGEIKIL